MSKAWCMLDNRGVIIQPYLRIACNQRDRETQRDLSITGMYIQRQVEIYQSPACIYKERQVISVTYQAVVICTYDPFLII